MHEPQVLAVDSQGCLFNAEQLKASWEQSTRLRTDTARELTCLRLSKPTPLELALSCTNSTLVRPPAATVELWTTRTCTLLTVVFAPRESKMSATQVTRKSVLLRPDGSSEEPVAASDLDLMTRGANEDDDGGDVEYANV